MLLDVPLIKPFFGYGLSHVEQLVGEENIEEIKNKAFPYVFEKGAINGWCYLIPFSPYDGPIDEDVSIYNLTHGFEHLFKDIKNLECSTICDYALEKD